MLTIAQVNTVAEREQPNWRNEGFPDLYWDTILHLFPAKYRQSARISVIVHRFRQNGIEHLLLDTAHEVRYSAA